MIQISHTVQVGFFDLLANLVLDRPQLEFVLQLLSLQSFNSLRILGQILLLGLGCANQL